jgi:uncharacterized protein (DUF2252 family)
MTYKRSRSPSQDPIDLIAQVNRGRVPELLQRKFVAMAADPFAFLRATAGLGHRSVDLAALPPVPVGWICGDLHLQNFGSFRGGNRLVYFDLNDFDEAARLPVCLDLLRLLGSIFTAAPGIGVTRPAALSLARQTVEAYARALARGKAFWLERETAVGPINALLKQTARRKRRDLLATRTQLEGARRHMKIDGVRYLAVAPNAAVRKQIARALAQMGSRFGDAAFFQLRDIAFRVAGMGSLGVQRYVALVQGKGDPGRNALIDFKHAVSSAAIGACPQFAQPSWSSEAGRVAGVQDLCQAASPAFLCALSLGDMPVVARELQPVEDKVALPPLARHLDQFDETLDAMARLSAYAQLRSAGRNGAAGADELIAFGLELLARPAPWIDAARAVDAANTAAYALFQAAWRDGDPRLRALVPQAPAVPPAPASAPNGAAGGSGKKRPGVRPLKKKKAPSGKTAPSALRKPAVRKARTRAKPAKAPR